MKPPEKFLRLIRESEITTNPEADERILQDARNELAKRLQKRTAPLDAVKRKSILPGRWAMLSLAATAMLILFLLSPWKGDLNGSISWADVQTQLEQIRSVSLKAYGHTEYTTGKQITYCGKVYHMNPGLSRAEIEVSTSDVVGLKPGANRIYIFRQESDRYNLLTLNPESKQAYLETRLFNVEDGRKPPFKQFMNTVSMSWKKIKEITEEKTRIIGDRVINGVPSVGFSLDGLPAETIYLPGYATVIEATVTSGQLWVNRKDGTPMHAEIEAKIDVSPIFGQKVHLEYTDIQWNIPLEESLFNINIPEGWLNKRLIKTSDYKGNKLAPGVTLNSYAYASGQESIITAEDVVGIVQAAQISYIDSPTPNETIITIELSQEAAQRLHDYADTHPDNFIRVTFNDQLNAVLALDRSHPNRLTFDLMGLYCPLSEIEEKYFLIVPERNS
jgi:outer membrane lipoprotein-sorting protein